MVKRLVSKVIAAISKTRSVTGTPVVEQPVAAEVRDHADVEDALSVLVTVDQYGRRLAGDDPALRHLLGGFELTLARQLGQQVRRAPKDR